MAGSGEPEDEQPDGDSDESEEEMGLSAIAAAAIAGAAALPNGGGQAVLDRTLHDGARDRDVPVRIYLPEGGGPFPTIVFSHGLGGSREGYGYLARAWAAHGYAVVLPQHAGSDGKIFRRLRSPTAVMREALADTRNWEDRPRDITFVIQALAQLDASDAQLAGRFDLARLGVGGHSFGAWTAAAVAGARIVFPGESAPRPLSDPRPRAFLLMSPTDYGERGLGDGAWSSITRPLLSMTGTDDRTLSGGSYEARTRPFRDLPPGDKWLVVIEGAEHLSFSGGRPLKRLGAPMQRAIVEASLAFWDAELNGDARAKSLLQPGALESDGLRVHVEAK